MSYSIIFACAWAIVANVIAMLPTKDAHWTSAYILIAVGIPILGYVTWQHGPWLGLMVLFAGMSLLRWPVIYLWRWVQRSVTGGS
ncbi:MAG: DUF2484 family protein [Marinovum sp.]|nr:DUF2484 family protein [Marinovum sp.]